MKIQTDNKIDKQIIRQITDKIGITNWFSFCVCFMVNNTVIGYYNTQKTVTRFRTTADKWYVDKNADSNWEAYVKRVVSNVSEIINHKFTDFEKKITPHIPELKNLTVSDIIVSIRKV